LLSLQLSKSVWDLNLILFPNLQFN
jgi:hypothetical protein